MNILYKDNYLKLPAKFNHLVGWIKNFAPTNEIHRHIYHYILRTLNLDITDTFSRLWFSYFIKTPFCTPESFGNLFLQMENLLKERNNLWKDFSNATVNKQRIFYAEPNRLSALANFFGYSSKDFGIDSTKQLSIETAMKYLKTDDHILLILDGQYWQIKHTLELNGFAENKDFFNASNLMNFETYLKGFKIVEGL